MILVLAFSKATPCHFFTYHNAFDVVIIYLHYIYITYALTFINHFYVFQGVPVQGVPAGYGPDPAFPMDPLDLSGQRPAAPHAIPPAHQPPVGFLFLCIVRVLLKLVLS